MVGWWKKFSNTMPPYGQSCPGLWRLVCRNIPFTELSEQLAKHVTQYTPKDKVVTRVSLSHKLGQAKPKYRVTFHLNTGDSVCTVVSEGGYSNGKHYEEIHKLALREGCFKMGDRGKIVA